MLVKLGELSAAFFDRVLFGWAEVLKLQTATETFAIAYSSCDAQSALDIRKDELHLHYLSPLQLCRDVDSHAVFAQIMAASLQDTLALLHDSKEFNREVHLEALRAANRMRYMCRN